MQKIIKVFLYSVLIMAGITFSVSNRTKIELTLFPLPYAISVPIFLFGITIFLCGLLLGWTILKFKMVRAVRHDKASVARVVALENELSALRSERRINTN